MKKKTKKMIGKIVKRSARILICGLLIMTQILPVYASISASDGIGYVSKPEFNSVLADFNARISSFETGLNTKIESLVSTYLKGIDSSGTKGYVINNEAEITGAKDATGVYTNVTAIIGIEIADLKIGDNIYIRDNNSYDYWVSQISPTVSLSVLNQKINVEDYQKNIISNVTGAAGEVLARNSTNNGLEFVAKQDIIIDTISGDANQLLARNSANDGLVFISKQDIFDIIRPTGSHFIQYGSTDNPNTIFNNTAQGIESTWTKVNLTASYIQLDKDKTAGTAVSEQLPNIKGTATGFCHSATDMLSGTGALSGVNSSSSLANAIHGYWGGNLVTDQYERLDFNARSYSTVYTDGGAVRPKGQTAILWKRTA